MDILSKEVGMCTARSALMPESGQEVLQVTQAVDLAYRFPSAAQPGTVLPL